MPKCYIAQCISQPQAQCICKGPDVNLLFCREHLIAHLNDGTNDSHTIRPIILKIDQEQAQFLENWSQKTLERLEKFMAGHIVFQIIEHQLLKLKQIAKSKTIQKFSPAKLERTLFEKKLHPNGEIAQLSSLYCYQVFSDQALQFFEVSESTFSGLFKNKLVQPYILYAIQKGNFLTIKQGCLLVAGQISFLIDLETQQIAELPSLNGNKKNFAISFINNFPAVIGGQTSIGCSKEVQVFQFGKWSLVPVRLNIPRSKHTACYYKKNTFVIGGQNEHQEFRTTATIEKYSEGKWKLLDLILNKSLRHPICCAISQKEILIVQQEWLATIIKVDLQNYTIAQKLMIYRQYVGEMRCSDGKVFIHFKNSVQKQGVNILNISLIQIANGFFDLMQTYGVSTVCNNIIKCAQYINQRVRHNQRSEQDQYFMFQGWEGIPKVILKQFSFRLKRLCSWLFLKLEQGSLLNYSQQRTSIMGSFQRVLEYGEDWDQMLQQTPNTQTPIKYSSFLQIRSSQDTQDQYFSTPSSMQFFTSDQDLLQFSQSDDLDQPFQRLISNWVTSYSNYTYPPQIKPELFMKVRKIDHNLLRKIKCQYSN